MRTPVLIITALLLFACGNSSTSHQETKPRTSPPANIPNNISPSASTGNNQVPVGINLNYVDTTGTEDQILANAKKDLDAIKQHGFTAVRLAIVDWADNQDELDSRNKHWRPLAEYALNLGLHVIYGISHNPPITADTKQQERYAQAVLNEAKWAQSLNNPNLELCIGNEDELHTSLSPAALRSFMRSLAARVKQVYTIGPVSYSSSSYPNHIEGWAAEGLGALDYLGFNVYYSDHEQFQGDVKKLADPNAKFHDHVAVTEWNIDGGFTSDEISDTTRVNDGIRLLVEAGIPSYFYTFRDDNPDEGKYGALMKGSSTDFHPAWAALTKG